MASIAMNPIASHTFVALTAAAVAIALNKQPIPTASRVRDGPISRPEIEQPMAKPVAPTV
jgi:hypothetical protein